MSVACLTVLSVSFVVWAEEPPPADRKCGARALSAVLQSLHVPASVPGLVGVLPRNGEDSSFQDLAVVAKQDFGVASIGVRWREYPPENSPPAIIPVAGAGNRVHFVAVLKWSKADVLIGNGAVQDTYPREYLRTAGWDGAALHFGRTDDELAALVPPWWKSPGGRWQVASWLILATVVLLVLPRVRFPIFRGTKCVS